MNIPLFKIYWDQEDIDGVSAVIQKGGYWAIGPQIKEFESRLAEFTGRKYVIAVSSGTAALHLCMAAATTTTTMVDRTTSIRIACSSSLLSPPFEGTVELAASTISPSGFSARPRARPALNASALCIRFH